MALIPFHRGLTRTAAAATLTAAGLLGGLASPASASPRADDTVSVSGHGSVKATPDTLVSDFDVHAKRASAQDAFDAAGQVLTAVVNALEANGVAAKDIQTSGLSVGPSYGKHGKVTGYRADEDITARMHPLDTAGKALDAAIAAGGNNVVIEDSQLTVSNKAKYEREARAKAFGNAKDTAQQFAELADRHLGRVETIRGSAHGPGRVGITVPTASGGTASGVVAAPPSASIPVNPGRQTVSASVHVVWALK